MTIDEAITFCNEKSKNIKLRTEPSTFEQLAEWLEELKSYRASVFSGDMTQAMLKEQYCKAVDDFVKEFKRKTPMENMIIDEIAERLKGDASNGTDSQ